MDRIRRNILAGLFVIIPIWVTLWVGWFILNLLVASGRPFVLAVARALRPGYPEVADLLAAPWFQSALALIVVIFALYVLGAATNAVIGRRLFRLVHQIMERTPILKTIYGATRTLVESIQNGAGGQRSKRVVLIEFPTPEMRAVGFVTKVFHTSDTGEEVAAVYVPTTPNPTSGYVEIVPTARVVWLDWTTNDAMAFIMSGGALSPTNFPLHPGGTAPGPPPPAPPAGQAGLPGRREKGSARSRRLPPTST